MKQSKGMTIVLELVKLRNRLAKLQKEETEIKAEVKALMGSKRLLVVGGYCVLIETRETSSLDKEKLLKAVGKEVIEKCTAHGSYDCLLVRPIDKKVG